MAAKRLGDDREIAKRRLAREDHEVIKTMEAFLVEQGKLPAEFKAKRDALRQRAKK